ncbi:MAG: calcium/sodium antiporter, partial [Candidatus Gracilibacteria bacterium]|nr:calcium/sodium antiporter [Candidatus Gracilibacteria bacterium]
VSGASALGLRANIPPLVIGLTIVAFGTSSPELAVNVFAAIEGKTDLAIGNILGSNIANILLILGVTAIVYPVTAKGSTIWKEIPFALLGALVLGIMANDILLDGSTISQISRSDSIVLLGFFIIFLYYVFGISKIKEVKTADDESIAEMSLLKSISFTIIGLVGLVLGGKFIVDGAVELAKNLGLSEAVIGLTVVAIGTSLPELATSIVAAFKKQSDIAIGNVVGSNIFNIFAILGISGIITPIKVQSSGNIDIGMTILASIVLFVFLFFGKKHQITRGKGILMVSMYVGYLGYLLVG